MSAANFFSVLGDDSSAPAVGSAAVHLEEIPKTASSTSSKKADVNPRADPSKARSRPQAPPSNDRVLRDSKNAGRQGNRQVPVQMGADSHHSRRAERTDRQPRSTKRDTPKRTRAGWGAEKDEPQAEELAEGDAKAAEKETAAEDAENAAVVAAEPVAPAAPKVSFDEYMQTQREQAAALNTRKPKAAAPASEQVAPAARAEVVPESRKKNTSKPAKEVKTLPLDTSVAPPLLARRERPERSERPERRERSERGPRGPRGDKPKKGGDKKEKSEKKPKAGPKIDLTALPTLN